MPERPRRPIDGSRYGRGATLAQVIEVVDESTPETKSELAEQLGLSAHYLSELLQELKRHDVVSKFDVDADFEDSHWALTVQVRDGQLRAGFEDAADVDYIGVGGSVPASTWTHLAVVYDGSSVVGYVDGSEVLVALGRRPNSDSLNLDAASIEVDDRGFVETNEYLETSAENVWAQGDVAGNALFKHSGDYETRHTVSNVVHEERRALDLSAMPHTIFTEPQIAGVGKTEAELDGQEYVVGRADYADSAMGRAKKLDEGFVKVLAATDGTILGAHAIGYEASTLLHEAVVAMRHGLTVEDVGETIHAHPTLSKVVEAAFRDATT